MNAALINYALHTRTLTPDARAQLESKLAVAKRRELKRLAQHLTYKADIYGPEGRIYSGDAKFIVSTDGKLFHGAKELDVAKLTDGHGRAISLGLFED